MPGFKKKQNKKCYLDLNHADICAKKIIVQQKPQAVKTGIEAIIQKLTAQGIHVSASMQTSLNEWIERTKIDCIQAGEQLGLSNTQEAELSDCAQAVDSWIMNMQILITELEQTKINPQTPITAMGDEALRTIAQTISGLEKVLRDYPTDTLAPQIVVFFQKLNTELYPMMMDQPCSIQKFTDYLNTEILTPLNKLIQPPTAF